MKAYKLNFRCYFPGIQNYTSHRVEMPLRDIPKWVEAYRFTHPNLENITVKIYMEDAES